MLSKNTKDISIIFLGRVLIVVTSLIYLRILTVFLSPFEVGRLSIIMTIYGWFGLVLLNPVGMYVNRKIVEWQKSGLFFKDVLCFLLKYFIVIIIIAMAIISVLLKFFRIGIEIHLFSLAIIMTGSILLTSGNDTFLGLLNILGRRFWAVLLTFLTIALGLLLSSILIFKFSPIAEYWISGQLLSQGLILILGGLVLFAMFSKTAKKLINKDKTFFSLDIFNFAYPLGIGNLLYWLHMQGYRFLFQKIAGIEALGIFVVGFGIGSNIVTALCVPFNQYYDHIFYNEIAYSEEEQRVISWNKYASAFLPFIVLCILYVAANGIFFAKILTGKRFLQSGIIVFFGAIAEGLRMMVSNVSMVSHIQLKMKPLILPSLTGAFVALLGVVIFTPIHPFFGVGLAIVLGWLFGLILQYKQMRKLLPVKFPWRRISYAFILSLPFILLFALSHVFGQTTFFLSSMIISVSTLYFILLQIILVRKWIILPFKLTFIDFFEQKLAYFYTKFM